MIEIKDFLNEPLKTKIVVKNNIWVAFKKY